MNVSTGSNGAVAPAPTKIVRRHFSAEVKKNAVLLVQSGKPVMAVAERVPVHPSVLRRWVLESKKTQRTKKPKKLTHYKRYSAAIQREVAARVAAGELVADVANSVGVSKTAIHDWVKKYAKGASLAEKQGSSLAIRDAITYLKHVKNDMYALLASGKIKEFEEYHLNTLAALSRLQSTQD